MKFRSWFMLITLILFILIGLFLITVTQDQSIAEQKDPKAVGSNTQQNVSATEAGHVVAYYFHGAKRCATCRKIESYAEEAIKEKFADALKAGKLEWRVLDISIPENKHFVDDYQLVSQSVVLTAVQDGKQTKWKNLDKVWQLVRDKQAFFSYIQTETANFLNENKA